MKKACADGLCANRNEDESEDHANRMIPLALSSLSSSLFPNFYMKQTGKYGNAHNIPDSAAICRCGYVCDSLCAGQ